MLKSFFSLISLYFLGLLGLSQAASAMPPTLGNLIQNGNSFPIGHDVTVKVDDDGQVSLFHGTVQLTNVELNVNDLGQVEYAVVPPAGVTNVQLISGRVSAMPSGSPRVEANFYKSDQTTEAIAIWGIHSVFHYILVSQTCDCSNNVDLTCNTLKCNNGDTCTYNGTPVCAWKPSKVHKLKDGQTIINANQG